MSDQLLNEKAKFEMVWEALIKLDIGAVTVEFEGSGDDGSIHSVEPDTGDERLRPTHSTSTVRRSRCAS